MPSEQTWRWRENARVGQRIAADHLPNNRSAETEPTRTGRLKVHSWPESGVTVTVDVRLDREWGHNMLKCSTMLSRGVLSRT